jgi:Phosphotransferase enzyme family
MRRVPTGSAQPDRALAQRDSELPCLADLLDDDRLSELLGEPVHVTRVRYKPHTSVLVAFRHSLHGRDHYGWARGGTPHDDKILGRQQLSRARGRDIRLVPTHESRHGALVAVGGFEDDWELVANLLWLRNHGLRRLSARWSPGGASPESAGTVLRYKPERRVVFMVPSAAGSVVIKAGTEPYDRNRQVHFWNVLNRHGVPVLPLLADARCSAHGIGASPVWGAGDLGTLHGDNAAGHAGEALAALHGISEAARVATAGSPPNLGAQLLATSAMVAALLPQLAETADLVASRLSDRLLAQKATFSGSLVHGDFSSDQVLVAGPEVRFIDFDRAHASAPEADLGSFAAVEETSTRNTRRARNAGGPKTAQLVDGYIGSGGTFSSGRLNLWAAYRLFVGSVEPFRDRAPEWAADMAWHLDRARELIK